ncbi:MAG: PAS domain S-box protein, partial [Deltaproteobacteria bacterium]|nr:PAS domain S-box protein [Deltaproteobacteria bacterium]
METSNKTTEQLLDELTAIRQDSTSIRQQPAESEALIILCEQIKEALQESEARLAGIVNIANEAIISIDKNSQIILFNQGAEKIFGYSTVEAIGEPLELLVPKRFRGVHQEHIADFAGSDITARLMKDREEIFGRRKNGEEFPAEASISKLTVGDQQFFTVVLRDISIRKQAEQEREERIVQLQALNVAARAISTEVSGGQVFQKITEVARTLVKAKYAALGIHDGQGRISRLITAGIDPDQRAKIGPLPVGRGLLGHFLQQKKSQL